MRPRNLRRWRRNARRWAVDRLHERLAISHHSVNPSELPGPITRWIHHWRDLRVKAASVGQVGCRRPWRAKGWALGFRSGLVSHGWLLAWSEVWHVRLDEDD